MFPQSELDNYKLQVELLQEKLQRSEISRQQLEQKLDRILQKRDEHDKLVRLKARQKYQQFLEEQQRRNERNKKLAEMMERIEQQTEILRAKSERLKMMRLQYEMYFAKLVHTQTTRCLQNSVQPVTHFMPSWPARPAVQQSAMTGPHYCLANAEMKRTTTPLCFATAPQEDMPLKISDNPTLLQFDPRNLNIATSTPRQQLNTYAMKTEYIDNMTDIPANLTYNDKQTILDHNTSCAQLNTSITNPSSEAYLLSNDKKLPESRERNNLSTATSSTFAEIPNLAMMPQKPVQTLNDTRLLNSNNEDAAINNYISDLSTVVQPINSPQSVNEMSLKSSSEKDNKTANEFNKPDRKSPETSNELQSPITKVINENIDVNMPNQNPSTSSQLENSSTVSETSLSSPKNKNDFKAEFSTVQPTEAEYLINNTVSKNSPVTPSISIENIENEIYGELLTPLATEEINKSQETASLLENLVTRTEYIENISAEGAPVKQDEEYNANNNEDNSNLYDYEQNITNNEYNNVTQSEESAKNFADYSNYENVDVDENQQQYDYSNYDPTQYSYPGYVYDETTGEYKPDPNAPLEQYATDQQYATEGYEQQQQQYQQQQQQDYDYNQAYAEETTNVTNNDNNSNTVNNNYDATPKDTALSNVTTTDINEVQPEMKTQPEPIPAQTVAATEEVTATTTPTPKLVKPPTSILSTADKSEAHKKKKRVNFIDSSETDESAAAAVVEKGAASTSQPANGNLAASSESDFDFSSSSTEAEAKGS